MILPEVRIRYSWLLAENASVGLNELWGKGEPLLEVEDYERIAGEYRDAWTPYEERILNGMCELLELSFRQNNIDVYVAPWFRAFSDPMVIGVVYTPDAFVETLAHELIHRLLTDNKESDYATNYDVRWRNLFGHEHSFGALVHIPVHAVYQALFDDIIGEPQRTKSDIEEMRQYDDYRKAWEYVGEYGYEQVIERLRKDYKEIKV